MRLRWGQVGLLLALCAPSVAPAQTDMRAAVSRAPVPRSAVAQVLARVDLPEGRALSDASAVPGGLHLVPAPADLGRPQAWQQWSERAAVELPTPASHAPLNDPLSSHEPTLRAKVEGCADWFLDEFWIDVDRLLCDFRNLYTGPNLCYLGLTLAVAAPLANTTADRHISNWYQRHVRSQATDDWTRFGYALGQHNLTVPIYLGVMLAGKYWDDTALGAVGYEWSNRTLRAMIIGAPAVGVLQYGLGAHRPSEGDSHWRPFHDRNSVAGHGFIGALPFLAAASMADNPGVKTILFAGSFWTTWARLNDDAHFASQCLLGWSIAYLSMRSVVQTDSTRGWIEIVPMDEPQGVGIGVHFRY
jgi:hypothetical protein